MRGILALGLAVALASSVPMQQAEASKAGDVAAGIAIGAGIAALAAASASSAQRYYNMPDYDYNHGISGEGNAIAACTHKAWRRASRDGARQLSLVKVKDTRWKGGDEWRVKLRVEARYGGGNRSRYDVVCRVIHDRVIDFKLA